MKKIYIYFSLFMTLIAVAAQAQIAGTWTTVGPLQFPANETGVINGIGRVAQFKFHPTSSSTMYAVSGTGGLWKTIDGAQTWQKTGTDNLPQTNTASVCIDYTNDQIIYLGTGDANYYSSGYGVWKSTDGGATWNISTKGLDYRLVIEILMDPKNHNVLLAATSDGIFKSTNGGATWTVKKAGGKFTDMVFKTNATTRTVYAATMSEFFVSYNMGDTWTQVSLPGAGFANGGRIGVTKADSSLVYLTFVGDGNQKNWTQATPVLKSTNSGQSFTVVKPANQATNLNSYPPGTNLNDDKGQGNYNYDITIDPVNKQIIYVVAHGVWKSTDGGATWNFLNYWYEKVHTDMHQINFSPYDNTKLFNANDGGVWLSTDQSVSWTPKSNGMTITEFYHAAQAKTSRDTLYGGTQDNGELYMKGSNWYTNRYADVATKMVVDYQNTAYYLKWGVRRTFSNNDQSFNYPSSIAVPNDDGNGDDIYMDFNPAQLGVATMAKRDIFITSNVYAATITWNQLTAIDKDIKALASSPTSANTVYAVTSDGHFIRVDNALTTPTVNDYPTPAPTDIRASIAVVKSNTNIVYLSCNSRMFRSTDKGATWSEISTGLPGINITQLIHDEYSTDESMYVGMATGVYYKNNTMNKWLNYSKGLPTLSNITDFMIFNNGTTRSRLRVSYYGRGVWETPLYHNTSINVAVTSPTDNSIFVAGSNISLTATASSTAGSITKVEYYNGSTLIGSSTTGPNYPVTWTAVPAGQYSLTAKAYTATGNNVTPFLTRVKVLKLRLPDTPPASGSGVSYNYYQGQYDRISDFTTSLPVNKGIATNFNIAARSRDTSYGFIYSGYISVPTDGLYTFYTSSDDGSSLSIGDTLLVNNDGLHGTVEVSGTIGLKAGKHQIKSIFFQRGGDQVYTVSYSGPGIAKTEIPGTVLYQNVFPSVSITSPANGSTFTPPASINVTATASDVDGSVAIVELFSNNTKIADLSTSPYTFNWTNVQAGTYTLLAKATDNTGLVNTATATVTVSQSCNFGTPLSTPLPTTNYSSYSHAYTLGQGGPNLSNVSNFTIQWDLQNNSLYSLSLNTTNGVPAYYLDLKPKSTNTFNQSSPSITFTNTGISGFDGAYYAAKRTNGDFVLVSKTGSYTLYFTNSTTTPTCSSVARIAFNSDNYSSEEVIVSPNPAETSAILDANMDMSNAVLTVTNLQGAPVKVAYHVEQNKVVMDVTSLDPGVYTVSLRSEDKVAEQKIVVTK